MPNIHKGDTCKWFRFELRGADIQLGMQDRRKDIRARKKAAINCIMANQVRGTIVIIRNFQRIKIKHHGFACRVFEAALSHLHDIGLIIWDGNSTSKSRIEYLPLAKKHIPKHILRHPSYSALCHVCRTGGAASCLIFK